MKPMPDYRFTVSYEQDEDGAFIAECLELRGCHADGATKAEAREMIREVIELHVGVLTSRGEPIPQPDLETLDLAM
jgi:predicted RNase H-like HicB family nuclease